MPKSKPKSRRDESTIENRVYLFESLARAFLEQQSALLASSDEEAQARVRRALGELAYVSCVVADTEHLSPEEVRATLKG
jgi:hypothetical protein